MRLQTTAIVRDRGQLTIPNDIREVIDWMTPASVVTIYIETTNKLVIQPHFIEKQINWEEIWNQVKLARSFIGESGNLSKFIAEDRRKH